jgi:hypothetical protein
MIATFTALKPSTDQIGMVIHSSKTQYICVNSLDTRPVQVGNISVNYTVSYNYLGTPISISPISEQVKQHLQQKTGHVLKFYSFIAKNADAPYSVKKTVWDSALKSAIFYSCETWLTLDIKAAETVFNSSLKNLLGVRGTTCNDIALLESGESGAKSYIRQLQTSFLQKLTAREQYEGSYLQFVINEALQSRCPAGRVLLDITTNGYEACNYHEDIIRSVQVSLSTRRVAYRTMNPQLKVILYPVHSTLHLPEYDSIAFTRVRLSSHHMKYMCMRLGDGPGFSLKTGCVHVDVYNLNVMSSLSAS